MTTPTIETYEIEVNDRIVEINRKNIKHLHLFVNPPFGNISASVPKDMSDEQVRAFVSDHEAWLEKKIKALDDRNWTSPRQFIGGESIWIFGRQCFLNVTDSEAFAFSYVGDKAVLNAPRTSIVKEREDFVYATLRKELRQIITNIMPEIETKTGIKPDDIVVEKRTTRWSSCNRKKNSIFLNGLLVHQPVKAIRMVLAYETLHLKYNPSDEEFSQKLMMIVPNWKEILDEMNEIPIPREDQRKR